MKQKSRCIEFCLEVCRGFVASFRATVRGLKSVAEQSRRVDGARSTDVMIEQGPESKMGNTYIPILSLRT